MVCLAKPEAKQTLTNFPQNADYKAFVCLYLFVVDYDTSSYILLISFDTSLLMETVTMSVFFFSFAEEKQALPLYTREQSVLYLYPLWYDMAGNLTHNLPHLKQMLYWAIMVVTKCHILKQVKSHTYT